MQEETNQTTYTQPAPNVDKGRYMTLAEFEAAHPEYQKRHLYRFIERGMPHDPRGNLFFVYEQEALAWIAQHVDVAPTYRIKKD